MTMCWLSEKTTGFAIYKRATENRAKIRASPTGRGTVGPVRLSEVWPVGSMRPRFCCVDRREHRMPYRVRSVILGVLSLLLFGPASSAAQSGPPAAEASVVYTGEMVGGAVGGLDQDVVYLDNVDVTATLRADSLVGWPGATGSSSFRSRRSRLACGYGWPGVGACRRRCWMACRATRRIRGHPSDQCRTFVQQQRRQPGCPAE